MEWLALNSASHQYLLLIVALKNHLFLVSSVNLIQKKSIYRYWFTVLFDRSSLIPSSCTLRAVGTCWALARMKPFNKGQRIKSIQLFWTTLNSSSQLFKPTWMSCPPIYSLALIIYAWRDPVTLLELIGVRLLKNDSLNILWICGAKRYSAVTFSGWRPADDQFFKPLMWISRKCSECENGFRIEPAPSYPKSFTVVIYTRHFWVFVFIVRWLGFCVKKEVGGGS